MERNLDIIKNLCPVELAGLICLLAYDCEKCPVEPEPNFISCRIKLLDWLTREKDERFWEYLLEGRKKVCE